MASYDSEKVAYIHEELHSHLPPEPTAKFSSAEPQRRPQEHLGKPLALAIIEPRPAFQSY